MSERLNENENPDQQSFVVPDGESLAAYDHGARLHDSPYTGRVTVRPGGNMEEVRGAIDPTAAAAFGRQETNRAAEAKQAKPAEGQPQPAPAKRAAPLLRQPETTEGPKPPAKPGEEQPRPTPSKKAAASPKPPEKTTEPTPRPRRVGGQTAKRAPAKTATPAQPAAASQGSGERPRPVAPAKKAAAPSAVPAPENHPIREEMDRGRAEQAAKRAVAAAKKATARPQPSPDEGTGVPDWAEPVPVAPESPQRRLRPRRENPLFDGGDADTAATPPMQPTAAPRSEEDTRMPAWLWESHIEGAAARTTPPEGQNGPRQPEPRPDAPAATPEGRPRSRRRGALPSAVLQPVAQPAGNGEGTAPDDTERTEVYVPRRRTTRGTGTAEPRPAPRLGPAQTGEAQNAPDQIPEQLSRMARIRRTLGRIGTRATDRINRAADSVEEFSVRIIEREQARDEMRRAAAASGTPRQSHWEGYAEGFRNIFTHPVMLNRRERMMRRRAMSTILGATMLIGAATSGFAIHEALSKDEDSPIRASARPSASASATPGKADVPTTPFFDGEKQKEASKKPVPVAETPFFTGDKKEDKVADVPFFDGEKSIKEKPATPFFEGDKNDKQKAETPVAEGERSATNGAGKDSEASAKEKEEKQEVAKPSGASELDQDKAAARDRQEKTPDTHTVKTDHETVTMHGDGSVEVKLNQNGTFWEGIQAAEHQLHIDEDATATANAVNSIGFKAGEDRQQKVGTSITFKVINGKLVAQR